ncbi:hypothetical protein NARC_90060 [Candidatus Nitrosocosmicus arcticus]|uniref:Uncharacterized protein n=1 Tax=Candidatus Nitrosocosmicus arcticus TaxID=2035267 RepID=A0A557SU63_9ARCH|nr:hypothetical protein NARC_90060 [Candidatus Nitrosocosmicus arcticus]
MNLFVCTKMQQQDFFIQLLHLNITPEHVSGEHLHSAHTNFCIRVNDSPWKIKILEDLIQNNLSLIMSQYYKIISPL